MGIVASVVKMRNLVYVEGFNPRYRTSESSGPLIFEEAPLEIDKEVSFVLFAIVT